MSKEIDITEIKEALRFAKEAVKDEEEPYRTEAFKIIFTTMIGKINSSAIPENIMSKISNLTNKEKIQLILYYSNKPLTKEEIKTKSLEYGIDEGWWHGSNFRRDMMKRNKLVIEDVDEKGVVRYRLTESAKVETRKLIESL
ncbi:MAG: hypothetical protein QW416_04020 [Candidatus Nitrosocaldaceae archaeon]